jgi:hypothetical protein
LSSGSYNTALGTQDLQANTTASNNTAVGYQASYTGTTGTQNTTMGWQSGFSNSTGSNNAFYGYYSGQLTTSSNNTFIGNGAGYQVTSGAKNTILGNYNGNQGGLDIRTSSNYIVLSDGDGNPWGIFDNSGNFMVGTTNVLSSGKYSSSFDGSVSNGIILKTTLASAGSTYIGFLNSAGSTIGSISQATGSTVAYNVTSDQRLKENIVDAPEFGSVIDSIQVRSFDWKTDHIHQRAGFIAQELVNIAPEAVHQPIKEDEMMAVDYSKLVPMLVKEIQSLRKRLADAGI